MKSHLDLQLSLFINLLSNVLSQFLPGSFPFGGPAPTMQLSGPAQVPPMMPSFPSPIAPFPSNLSPFSGPIQPFSGPMSFQMSPQRNLPVVMMPYHSKKTDKLLKWHKKRFPSHPRKKHHHDSASSDSSSSSDSSFNDSRAQERSKSKRKRRRQVLTPMVSYVKKNGDVVYQKKIKRERAKDWLKIGRLQDAEHNIDDIQESEERNAKDKQEKMHHRY